MIQQSPVIASAPSSVRKRGPRGRYWCVTSYAKSPRRDFDAKHVRYVIYQWEVCPETKRQHVQAYVEFFDAMRIGQVQRYFGDPKAHCEVRRATRTEAREYCRKRATAILHTQYEWGTWREEVNRRRKLCEVLRDKNLTRNQLIEDVPHFFVMYHKGIDQLYAHRAKRRAYDFRTVVVTVYVGPSGVGKTRKATEGPFGSWFMMPLSGKMWFDGYAGEETLILDEFSGKMCMPLPYLLRVLDGHALQVQVKGAFVWAQWNRVIITSNTEPEFWYEEGLTTPLKRRISNNFTTEVVHMTMDKSDVKHDQEHHCVISARPTTAIQALCAVADVCKDNSRSGNQLQCDEVLDAYLQAQYGDVLAPNLQAIVNVACARSQSKITIDLR